MATIGQRLKELREKHNFTQAEMAHKLDVTTSAYNQYEKDIIKPIRKINELSTIFNVTTDYILGNESTQTVEDIELTAKDEKHIAKLLESILDDVEAGNTFAAHGGTIEDEVEKELFKKSLHEALSYAKKKAKLKFTPKKFQR